MRRVDKSSINARLRRDSSRRTLRSSGDAQVNKTDLRIRSAIRDDRCLGNLSIPGLHRNARLESDLIRSQSRPATAAICAPLPFQWGAKRWSLRLGTWLGVGDDPRSTPTTTFETFPLPKGLTPNIPAADTADDPRAQRIAGAAKALDDLRRAWLNPPDLVDIVPEATPTAAPGEAPRRYRDRILPKSVEAAAKLRERTLTNLYNQRPRWLADAPDAGPAPDCEAPARATSPGLLDQCAGAALCATASLNFLPIQPTPHRAAA